MPVEPTPNSSQPAQFPNTATSQTATSQTATSQTGNSTSTTESPALMQNNLKTPDGDSSPTVRMPNAPMVGTIAMTKAIQGMLDTQRKGKLTAKDMEIAYMQAQPEIVQKIGNAIKEAGKLAAKKEMIQGIFQMTAGSFQVVSTGIGAKAGKSKASELSIKEETLNTQLKEKLPNFKGGPSAANIEKQLSNNKVYTNGKQIEGIDGKINTKQSEIDTLNKNKENLAPGNEAQTEKLQTEIGTKQAEVDALKADRKRIKDTQKEDLGDEELAQTTECEKLTEALPLAEKLEGVQKSKIDIMTSETHKWAGIGQAVSQLLQGTGGIVGSKLEIEKAAQDAAMKMFEGDKEMIDKAGTIANEYGQIFDQGYANISATLEKAIEHLYNATGTIKI